MKPGVFDLFISFLIGAAVARTSYGSKETLVLYVFSDTDPEYYDNLVVFTEHGIRQDTTAEYIIIAQGASILEQLPELPSHARYVLHANECYDWYVHQRQSLHYHGHINLCTNPSALL